MAFWGRSQARTADQPCLFRRPRSSSRASEFPPACHLAIGTHQGDRTGMSTHHPIEPWAANLILSGVNRLDCAITTLGCITADLDDGDESDNPDEVAALRWLCEMFREAKNIRDCVAMAQSSNVQTAKAA
jgi:hypothetical protein